MKIMIHKIQLTQDGSPTLWSEEFGEAYHSRIGALREAREKFLEPWLASRTKADSHADETSNRPLKILDACFGLGYNSFCFLDHFWDALQSKESPRKFGNEVAYPTFTRIEIIAIENDSSLLERLEMVAPFFPRLKNLISGLIRNSFWENDFVRIQLTHSPLETLFLDSKSIPQNDFDLVLHDAFSPAKCPELWCAELFQEYFRRLKDGGKFITYASAAPVSAALIEAGFSVHTTKSVGRKQGGLMAVKNAMGFVEPSIASLFAETTACVPYRVGGLNERVIPDPISLRQIILKNWQDEKAKVVSRGKITIKKYLKIQKSG